MVVLACILLIRVMISAQVLHFSVSEPWIKIRTTITHNEGLCDLLAKTLISQDEGLLRSQD